MLFHKTVKSFNITRHFPDKYLKCRCSIYIYTKISEYRTHHDRRIIHFSQETGLFEVKSYKYQDIGH